jgi:type II secretory pathway component GspD/PulD (secretin)
MKKYIALCLTMLFVLAAHAQEGTFNFINARVSMVLDVYGQLSGKQLVIESGVTNQTKTITVRTLKPATKQEAMKLLESALREQADVVFESLDEKRVAVKLVKK